jgi:hypothetical protein
VITVTLVNLPLHVNVSLVVLTESTHHNVHVKMVSLKTHKKNVKPVTSNVLPANPNHTVLFVLVTELMLQIVTVQLILMTLMKKSVQLVQMLVKNVIWMVTVPSVKLTEKTHQNVLVYLIILKLKSKENFSVKFVMLDVLNVTMFSISVILALLTVLELMLQNVNVQLVT